jgi:hypothetical protein
MESLNLPEFAYKVKQVNGKPHIFDIIRRKFVSLTPEEWVRQHFIHLLITQYGYPKSLVRGGNGNAIQYPCQTNGYHDPILQFAPFFAGGMQSAIHFSERCHIRTDQPVQLHITTSISGSYQRFEPLLFQSHQRTDPFYGRFPTLPRLEFLIFGKI